MERTLKEIAADALQMDADARAALAKTLLDSLDELSAEEHDQLWVREAAERYRALRAGEISSSPSEEVFERLQSRSPR